MARNNMNAQALLDSALNALGFSSSSNTKKPASTSGRPKPAKSSSKRGNSNGTSNSVPDDFDAEIMEALKQYVYTTTAVVDLQKLIETGEISEPLTKCITFAVVKNQQLLKAFTEYTNGNSNVVEGIILKFGDAPVKCFENEDDAQRALSDFMSTNSGSAVSILRDKKLITVIEDDSGTKTLRLANDAECAKFYANRAKNSSK